MHVHSFWWGQDFYGVFVQLAHFTQEEWRFLIKPLQFLCGVLKSANNDKSK